MTAGVSYCPDPNRAFLFKYNMKHFYKILTLSLSLLMAVQSTAQIQIRGSVYDKSGEWPIADVHIQIDGSRTGTITDAKGHFELKDAPETGTILISHSEYKSIQIQYHHKGTDFLAVTPLYLDRKSIALQTVDILAFSGRDRQTPVTISSIGKQSIQTQTADHAYPELMRYVPGVYASRTGGGVGDAAINIRGFKQENLALTLNGIPIGSVENGLVYWSNWDGLGDATENIQVQKGIGVSDLVNNSLGGTINIITNATAGSEGGSLTWSTTDYGLQRTSFKYATIPGKDGLSVRFMGSRTTGQGYADGTQVAGWSYFLNITKQFNARHKLVFSAIGSPERHGQRNSKLSYEEIEKKGIRFNKDWGTYEGIPRNLAENFYHKPLISLNHYWNPDDRTQVATLAYFSYGSGGGKWAENFSGPYIFNYRTPSGQIDWDGAAWENVNHQDYYLTNQGDTLRNFSKNAQTLFLASHYWAGLISAMSRDLGSKINLTAGIHARHFKSKLWQEVYDLMGGDFFIDNYAWAAEGTAGREIRKLRGDKVRIDNGAIVGLVSGFTKITYNHKGIHSFVSAGGNHNSYRREDRYNYPSSPQSQMVSRWGGEIKAGVNARINRNNDFYANMGYFSRAPYYKFVFPNFNNNPAYDARNEKITNLEAGIQHTTERTFLRLNAYYIYWKDKSLLSNEYKLIDNAVSTRAMVNGLDALHIGVELEARQKIPGVSLELGGFVSMGNWKWRNNVTALLFNNENQLVDTVRVYADGLYVGDAPQFQAGILLDAWPEGPFRLHTSYTWNDRFYADFDPARRTNNSQVQPYRIPAYGIAMAQAGFSFHIMDIRAYASVACNNIFDTVYVVRGEDGSDHDRASFLGYWGMGRTFRVSLRLDF
jgi:hypothetical protein